MDSITANWPNTNKNLQAQYKTLEQSTANLNFVTTEFVKKLKDLSAKFADEFLSNDNMQELAELESHDDAVLMIYKDSMLQRFLNCYSDTMNFLSLYLDANFLIQTNDSQKIIELCRDYKIITQTEFNKFKQLTIDYKNLTQDSNAEFSEEVIQYCLLMCNIVKRFKN
jgi:hypothetical protein